jgi:hypothetical protein
MASGALSTMASWPGHASAVEPDEQTPTRRADLAAWLSALSLAGLGRPVGSRPDWEREATSVARSWLRLVDDGRHPASWATAAPLLQEEVGPRAWDEALRAVRGPLGRCHWRKLESTTVVEGPAGDLRGPYVVIRFGSVFERNRHAVETITPMLGPDGGWRVAAYFIS